MSLTSVAPAAVFYLAILLPGTPFALVMWKVKYDCSDLEDLLECFSMWFVGVCFLVYIGPALAIGNEPKTGVDLPKTARCFTPAHAPLR